jgi:Serine incorporator (Serinc)
VEKSERSSNNSWLYALIITSFALLIGSIAAIGVMFWQFYGCPENDAILIITVVLCFTATCVQIFLSEDGSLLVSSFVVAYSTYLCFAAVSLNPNTECNPTLSTRYQNVSQGIGIAITVISLMYTAYSSIQSAPSVVAQSGDENRINEVLSGDSPDDPQSGQSTQNMPKSKPLQARLDPDDYKNDSIRKIFFLVLFIFITMAAYYAMVSCLFSNAVCFRSLIVLLIGAYELGYTAEWCCAK